jgi:tetratricopeptide (TPR) repeat protein
MSHDPNIIKKRQEYYWLGRKYEEENDLPQAILAYLTYSSHLAEVDQHIPHQWISRFYKKLGDIDKSLFHLEEFAKGCTKERAAKVYKKIGEKYLAINSTEKAISNFEQAVRNNPSIGVKKKLVELKNRLL